MRMTFRGLAAASMLAAIVISGCAQEAAKHVEQSPRETQSAPVEQKSYEKTAGHVTNILISNGPMHGRVGPNGEVLPDSGTFRYSPSTQPAKNMLSLIGASASVTDPTARFTQGGFAVTVNVGSSTATPTGTLGSTFTGGAQTSNPTVTANPSQTPTSTVSASIPVAVGAMPTANAQSTAAGAGQGGTPTASGAPTNATPTNTQTLPPPPVPPSTPPATATAPAATQKG